MYVTVPEGPLNCLSLNRECTHVVTAGRNAFKVFSIEEDEFIEKYNMRIGRNLNLNYSAVDVTWNPIDDNILASAATNGAVVTWNLNKASRNKQDLVFMEHKRCVSKVAFHSNEYQLLMSGSQDGHMKIFDLRKKEVATTFFGKSDSVRDIQFNPHHYFIFVASFDNGNVQIWDMRNPSRWERQFTAHNGPVFSIDMHPEEKNWIATSGRDKLIKIWDMSNPQKTKNSHSVQTIASVARIKWRPQRKYHITSCSLLVDFSVNVWDIRRPYIPFAAFNEHKDVVTGIQWRSNEPHQFYTSSKDCNLYQHMFRQAVRPADSANPVGVDININGDILQATSDKLLTSQSHKSNYSQTMLPAIFRRAPDRTEQFTMVTSILSEFDNIDLSEDLSMQWFTESAKKYKLTGRSLEDICDHNANVAEQLNREQVSQSWRILKLLFSTTPVAEVTSLVNQTKPGFSKSELSLYKEKDSEGTHCVDGLQNVQNGVTYDDNRDNKGDASTVSEEESDFQENDNDQRDMTLTNIASGMGHQTQSDFFFGNTDVEQTGYNDYGILPNITNGQEWSLPTEAFNIRHDIESQRPQSPDPIQAGTGNDSPTSDTDNDTASTQLQQAVMENQIRHELLSASTFLEQVTNWEFSTLICDMLQHYADRGDVQMAVSVLIVLGDKIREHINEVAQEQWFMSYIDLLSRFQMYSAANEIIKLSHLPAISTLNHQSTTIHVGCSNCNKPQSRAGWLCEKCKNHVHTCSICHLPVKGLFVWCQGCSHGGHVDHIQEWLHKYKTCPTGCGHLCQFT